MKALEESGRVRRGYFAADLGATQFAMPAAVDLLRSLRIRRDGDPSEVLLLAATDPANPYGSLLKWPTGGDSTSSLQRSVGARVVLCRRRAAPPISAAATPTSRPSYLKRNPRAPNRPSLLPSF